MNVLTNNLPPANGLRLINFEKKTASALSIQNDSAFTLIELLVVISIIGVLAAFTVPVLKSIAKVKYINAARAEMSQLETAIDSYKNDHGYYPPDNPAGANDLPPSLTNQLYYELEGTTLTNLNGTLTYITLDGATQIAASDVPTAFSGVSGFVNCTKAGASEDTQSARNFIHELKPGQTGILPVGAVNATLFTAAVGGPEADYKPLGQSGLNPWRYVSSNPKNNHGSYDLWIQLKIGGKTYLISNWSTSPKINDNSVP